MKMLKSVLPEKGFGLIEVLITLLVLGVSMTALAKLQGLLLRGSSAAQAQSVALNLAQGKLEDLHSFIQLATGNGVFAYADIGNNIGGNIPSGQVTVANVIYNRTWTVASYYYCSQGGGSVPTPTSSNCNKPYPDVKVVTVTVTWSDLDGPQSIGLESTLNANNPANGV